MHINEGKGKLAFFYAANNALLTPLLFIFIFPPPPQFSFLNVFIPSSIILLFSLLNLDFPPPPQFYYFPSSTSTSSFILYICPSTNISTSYRPHSTLHRLHIDPTSTLHRLHIDPTSTLYSTFFEHSFVLFSHLLLLLIFVVFLSKGQRGQNQA